MVDSEPLPGPAGATPPGPSAVRVGDGERNAAVNALGEHLTTGRLDLEEFGNRSAKASSARTVGELQELFTDLPAPHPPLPTGASPLLSPRPLASPAYPATGPVYPAAAPIQPVGSSTPALVDDRSKAQKLVAAAAGASGVLALLLFFTVGGWWWFLLIPLISSVAQSVWGESWKRPDSRR